LMVWGMVSIGSMSSLAFMERIWNAQ
jgi:hypothetical protein